MVSLQKTLYEVHTAVAIYIHFRYHLLEGECIFKNENVSNLTAREEVPGTVLNALAYQGDTKISHDTRAGPSNSNFNEWWMLWTFVYCRKVSRNLGKARLNICSIIFHSLSQC